MGTLVLDRSEDFLSPQTKQLSLYSGAKAKLGDASVCEKGVHHYGTMAAKLAHRSSDAVHPKSQKVLDYATRRRFRGL